MSHRIAIVNPKKCKPKKCNQECKNFCPVIRIGKLCIDVSPTSKIANISEELCIGCGICVQKCPFDAIKIINLPKGIQEEVIYRYGANSFVLHRLPMPKQGKILGLVGINGIGKSTCLKILTGTLLPNFGNFSNPPSHEEIIHHFRGSELQNYFTKLFQDDITTIIKPQYVDHISRIKSISTKKVKDAFDIKPEFLIQLDLEHLLDRRVDALSGGELQRCAIAITCSKDKDVYIFDEPSSYLDVHQRLQISKVIRKLAQQDKYVIVVEHDLSVLDYLSDYISVLYGEPGAYGVVTQSFGVGDGINIFLDGFIPTENMRFRDYPLDFHLSIEEEDEEKNIYHFNYPLLNKSFKDFSLQVNHGSFESSQITVLVGQNGTGKTTLVKLLAGLLKSDNNVEIPSLGISYKPQKIAPRFKGTVRMLFFDKIRTMFVNPQFDSEVLKPMRIEPLLNRMVNTLSGGELQRVAIVLALGKPADIYLFDEPSAYLDAEERINTSKVIKRFILNSKKSAFIVEHDFIMTTYLADQIVVFSGIPGKKCIATSPQTMTIGMNQFLKDIEITFRRDKDNYRPRINKLDSLKDQEQKKSGNYFM